MADQCNRTNAHFGHECRHCQPDCDLQRSARSEVRDLPDALFTHTGLRTYKVCWRIPSAPHARPSRCGDLGQWARDTPEPRQCIIARQWCFTFVRTGRLRGLVCIAAEASTAAAVLPASPCQSWRIACTWGGSSRSHHALEGFKGGQFPPLCQPPGQALLWTPQLRPQPRCPVARRAPLASHCSCRDTSRSRLSPPMRCCAPEA